MDVTDDLRQLVAPSEDQAGQLQQPGGVRERLQQVGSGWQVLVEIAAIFIGFAKGPDNGEDRRLAAEQIDKGGAQHAGCTACRQIDRYLGKGQRIGRIVAKVFGQPPVAQRCCKRRKEGQSRRYRQDALPVLHDGSLVPTRRSVSSAASIASGVPTVSHSPSSITP